MIFPNYNSSPLQSQALPTLNPHVSFYLPLLMEWVHHPLLVFLQKDAALLGFGLRRFKGGENCLVEYVLQASLLERDDKKTKVTWVISEYLLGYVITGVCGCSFNLCESGALHVFDSSEVSGQLLPTLGWYGALLVFGKFFHSVTVIPQVHLSAHKKEWSAWTMVRDLWYPLREKECKTTNGKIS